MDCSSRISEITSICLPQLTHRIIYLFLTLVSSYKRYSSSQTTPQAISRLACVGLPDGLAVLQSVPGMNGMDHSYVSDILPSHSARRYLVHLVLYSSRTLQIALVPALIHSNLLLLSFSSVLPLLPCHPIPMRGCVPPPQLH